jgi:prepilin peptidase CpaA
MTFSLGDCSMPAAAQWLFFVAVAAFTLAAAVTDLRTRRLPNWLTVPAFAAALVFHGVSGGLSGLGEALAGFAVGFGALFVLWLIGGGGGGDVKLMGALGAWLGPKGTLLVFFLSAVFALIGTAGVVMVELVRHGFQGARSALAPRSGESQARRKTKKNAESPQPRRRRVMPYAAPVAVATWLVLAWRFLQLQG